MGRVAFGGYILAGGSSSRMGVDKAFLRIDGKPLLVRVASALQQSEAITVVGGDQQRVRDLGLSWIPDDRPGLGPLGGIHTAVNHCSFSVAVIFSCDLPAITATATEHLLDHRGDAGCCVPVVAGRTQWHAGAWSVGETRSACSLVPSGSIFAMARRLRPSLLLDTYDDWYRDLDTPADVAARTTMPRSHSA